MGKEEASDCPGDATDRAVGQNGASGGLGGRTDTDIAWG